MDFIDKLLYIDLYNMNNFLIKRRQLLVLAIDIFVGFFVLCLTLFIRYGLKDFISQFENHKILFSFVIFIFIFSFYIFNLYSPRFNKNITEFNDSFIKSVIVSFLLSILFFYIAGSFFNLAPKTNLVVFTLLFGSIDFYLRILIKRQYIKHNIQRKILIINKNKNTLLDEIKNNHNAGYEIISECEYFDLEKIKSLKPDLVLIDKTESENIQNIYSLSKDNIYTATIQNFYEQTFQKIPIEIIKENEIVNYIGKPNNLFIFTKRFIDIFASTVFIIILSPIIFTISILIKLTSKGSILFKQKRVGLNDKIFIIYKFRSMHIDAEKDGPVWTKDDKTDDRITKIGRILRKTHLDEIPQLINILNGDLSFVGPRPERPEFTKIIEEKNSYYSLRHDIKPGLTGWAQINYRYGASVEDALEKLKYDFYYIKNKNIFFDILIIIKTFAMILKKH